MADSNDPLVPQLELPKGGGAIRGIGEKFGQNPANGTGAMTIPISVSSGRSGFGPHLSLSYDSGAGNGPFGLGWSLSLPRITRKTDKGLPFYDDSDVFIMSDAEDLVPFLHLPADGDVPQVDRRERDGYLVERFRPRVEGSFSRIERWTRAGKACDVHWRVLTRDNVLSVFGRDPSSRITDPERPNNVFSWLICETRDDVGNVVLYEYKADDGAGIDLARSYERNRGDRNDSRRKSNRYIKRIRYGNRAPLLDAHGFRPFDLSESERHETGWMFEVVFDYGEHSDEAPTQTETAPWPLRPDPFASYRSRFEIRTTRLCHRVLMFHHFPDEPEVGAECLVHSTDFTYGLSGGMSALTAASYAGYMRRHDGYLRRSLPQVEIRYSEPRLHDTQHVVHPASFDDLPWRSEVLSEQWIDLDGEGIPGILLQTQGAWYFKSNLGRSGSAAEVEFAPLQALSEVPSLAYAQTRPALMDVAGDGTTDVAVLDSPGAGFFARSQGAGWDRFREFELAPAFTSRDPNVRMVDLDGDGIADLMITEEGAITWQRSLLSRGFALPFRVAHGQDEESGPRLIFGDGTETVFLADMSGDGLSDLVRIRTGEICYWANEGRGRFGAKISMADAPVFEQAELFDPARIRLADVDGSGTTDIVYLDGAGARVYFNQSGNGWSGGGRIAATLPIDDLSSVQVTDLLGDGTACLVWHSPASDPGDRLLRYVELMGGTKPHLLTSVVNNLGSETYVTYASSTAFYLRDSREGKPWRTKLAFPVQVVERVETVDRVGRISFATRFAYHDGYFDPVEREFRGFGMTERWDTEVADAPGSFDTVNWGQAYRVPPVYVKTWRHTGAHLESPVRPPEVIGDDPAGPRLPELTRLPAGLSPDEFREASRALRGSVLRTEIYGLDGSPQEGIPYTVSQQAFDVHMLQPQGPNRYAVFLTHMRESLGCNLERRSADPRIQHDITLEVDRYGNILQQAVIAYGRRETDPLLIGDPDWAVQGRTLISYTHNRLTNPIGDMDSELGQYRLPLPAESRTYELTGCVPEDRGLFTLAEWGGEAFGVCGPVEEIPFESVPSLGRIQRRLIGHSRTLYRPDDLGAAQGDPDAVLSLGRVEPRAIRAQRLALSLTTGLVETIMRRAGEALVPDPAALLGVEGRYMSGRLLADAGTFPDEEQETDTWWLPMARGYMSPGHHDSAAEELAYAVRHFFLTRRVRDPFYSAELNTESHIEFDRYDLLVAGTRDPLGNRMTVGQRLPSGELDLSVHGNDYRMLAPRLIADANRNRQAVIYDALGMIAATAVMGKPEEDLGDSLQGVDPEPSEAFVREYLDAPLRHPSAVLGRATSRLIYDLFAFARTSEYPDPHPVAVSTLRRLTHESDLEPGEESVVELEFAYSDGFGRTAQKKTLAEAAADRPTGDFRWVGSGWTVFNNKGDPARQFEPYFAPTHRFEFETTVGVSSVLFYDPIGRLVATLHPNHTYEKVVIGAWGQESWDVNDTVLEDPRADPDIGPYVRSYFEALSDPVWQTWYEARREGQLGAEEAASAAKTVTHARTPTVTYRDPLCRTFRTITHDGFGVDGSPVLMPARVELDISGNRRVLLDGPFSPNERERVVARLDYDLLGNRLHQAAMDSGDRWFLTDVMGAPLRSWDSRGHRFRSEYDALHRPLTMHVLAADPRHPEAEIVTERVLYGELRPGAERRNLRGSIYRYHDQTGLVINRRRDFKANLVCWTQRLCEEFREVVDWSQPNQLQRHGYTSESSFDALNRQVISVTPGLPGEAPQEVHFTYNVAGLLDRVTLSGGNRGPASIVDSIEYDAKGQRRRIAYGNGAVTRYDYDRFTYRPVSLVTDGRGDDQLQNLKFTYDPVGNITHRGDLAQQLLFFRNHVVEPSNDYTFDPLYRVVRATGREHLGQARSVAPYTFSDGSQFGLAQPGDGHAMARYVEEYRYDGAGNLLAMRHHGSATEARGWTRHFDYVEPNPLDGTFSNRLSTSTLGATAPASEFRYDAHGNTTSLPHLEEMRWDYSDRLQMTRRQRVVEDSGADGERTYYVYDASGQRIRKVTTRADGHVKDERIYIGSFEVYRRHAGPHTGLIRLSLHVSDDQQLVALVETRNEVDDGTERHVTRFQLTDLLSSSIVELDDRCRVVTFEEFSPYGSTTYEAQRGQTEAPKRYRYASKERDDESGFYMTGVRYYAPWLVRWISCDDPLGNTGSPPTLNRYLYVHANPIIFSDPDGKAINLVAAGIGLVVGAVGGAIIGAVNAKPGERWSGAAVGAGVGAVAGGLAGLTFGASLAATGAIGVGGTAVATGGTTGSLLISGTLAGAVGGGTNSALTTLANGGTGEQALEMGSVGAFTGSIGGAVTGGTSSMMSPSTSQLTNFAISGMTGGATADAVGQGVSISMGAKVEFSGTELSLSAAVGLGTGALASGLTPEPLVSMPPVDGTPSPAGGVSTPTQPVSIPADPVSTPADAVSLPATGESTPADGTAAAATPVPATAERPAASAPPEWRVPNPDPQYRPSGLPNKSSAAYINVMDEEGNVCTFGSERGGTHAEDAAQSAVPGGLMSKAFGWRSLPESGEPEIPIYTENWVEIPICQKCQGNYPPDLFPPDVQSDPGPWSR